ncbi:AmmeMemoRadiSam system radical SAM enzyme [Acidaminobacter hydrogenoformans]|uniref:Pyruvate formate lyase activating enzyme n=1 Tax=Acidaminobacter hydrogenoformans DSM 2784 TaxID=1120920 RepID=A0A1G5RXM9_9FIRM|nr:AmmeMemoRadiSam system radical SAM enzyme [Acidaminobacter hydrogenoformans]SCZ78895.1 pyruvate formate lyase activating enzyme [Acidaminobacter hydrogenoformans DSM 2784]
MKEAMFYQKREAQTVQCLLCPRSCVIEAGYSGNCLARKNEEGVLYSASYGQITSFGVDPIEKKPLYHYFPGRDIVSFGSFGCNLHCLNCQNYRISQFVAPSVELAPEALLARSLEEPGSIGIAATYNEPTVNLEYVLEVFKGNRAAGRKNVLVTNGYINPKPLAALLDWTDAVNLDVKAYDNGFYESVCKATLAPVMRSMEAMLERPELHTELTWLLIEGHNDAPDEISAFSERVAAIRPETVLHISRYYPNYLMNHPETRREALFAAQDAAKAHLNYVYIGNFNEGDHGTYCRSCGACLVDRHGYEIAVKVKDRFCPKCGTPHSIRMD